LSGIRRSTERLSERERTLILAILATRYGLSGLVLLFEKTRLDRAVLASQVGRSGATFASPHTRSANGVEAGVVAAAGLGIGVAVG
jgi:hypothetical protein